MYPGRSGRKGNDSQWGAREIVQPEGPVADKVTLALTVSLSRRQAELTAGAIYQRRKESGDVGRGDSEGRPEGTRMVGV
jgi:hypothetical protein